MTHSDTDPPLFEAAAAVNAAYGEILHAAADAVRKAGMALEQEHAHANALDREHAALAELLLSLRPVFKAVAPLIVNDYRGPPELPAQMLLVAQGDLALVVTAEGRLAHRVYDPEGTRLVYPPTIQIVVHWRTPGLIDVFKAFGDRLESVLKGRKDRVTAAARANVRRFQILASFAHPDVDVDRLDAAAKMIIP